MKAVKQAVAVHRADGNTMTVDATVYDETLALYRYSKAYGRKPMPLDFLVATVADGLLVGYFKKQATAKAYIEHLLAYHRDALSKPNTERNNLLLSTWQGFYRRDFPAFPIPEEK